MGDVLVHFSVRNNSLNELRRKGLNKYRVVQLVFDFFTFFSEWRLFPDVFPMRGSLRDHYGSITGSPRLKPSDIRDKATMILQLFRDRKGSTETDFPYI